MDNVSQTLPCFMSNHHYQWPSKSLAQIKFWGGGQYGNSWRPQIMYPRQTDRRHGLTPTNDDINQVIRLTTQINVHVRTWDILFLKRSITIQYYQLFWWETIFYHWYYSSRSIVAMKSMMKRKKIDISNTI